MGKESDPKEIERNYLEAKELYEKQVRSAQLVRRDNTERSFNKERIFEDEAGESQYWNSEREFARGPSRRMRRVKKCSPSSRGLPLQLQGSPSGWGAAAMNHQVKKAKMKKW